MNVCRLCLAKDANFPVVNSTAAIRIMACISLEIEPGDGLPQHICTICRLRLEEINSYRRRCLAVDRRLKRRKVLQRQEPKAHMATIAAQEEAEEELALRDVAGCTVTACSENNAQWRVQAARLIRTEIDAYKKELLDICKQNVRAEIENEVRAEVMGVLMAEAKQKLHLSVLDDLFDELEAFFVRKRNEAAFGSDSFCSGSDQRDAANSDGFFEAEESLVNEDVGVVELLDDETEPMEPEANAEKTQPASAHGTASVDPMPMVEINMSDTQLSHLREEYSREVFLDPKTTPGKNVRAKPPSAKKVRFESPRKVRFCRKHSNRTKRYSEDPCQPSDCVCCRLRGAHKLNSTVS